MNTIMAKIKTTPRQLGRLDPDWGKYQRNRFIYRCKENLVILVAIIGLVVAFMIYKGVEKQQKQKTQNEQYK